MKSYKVDGKTYLLVRQVGEGPVCGGCIGYGSDNPLCAALKVHAPETEGYWCHEVVWIPNTEEARTAHAIKLLEGP